MTYLLNLNFQYEAEYYELSTGGGYLGATCRIMDYTPTYAGDGEATTYEECEIELSGTSVAQVQGALRKINKFLLTASEYKGNRTILEPFVGITPSQETTAWISRCYGGEIIHDEQRTLNTPFWDYNGKYRIQAKIGWIRDNYWEAGKVTIEVANSNMGTPGAGTAAAANVYNATDFRGTAPNILDNSLYISGSDVDGDLPAPACITVQSKINDANLISKIYMANCDRASTWSGTADIRTNIPYYRYEGESSSIGGTAGGTAYSGTAYMSGTVSSTTETNLFNWTISPLAGIVLKGDVYNIMARFGGTTGLNDVKFRWKLLSGTTAIWNGPQFQLATPGEIIQYMGAANIPPQAYMGYTPGTVNLMLTGQRISTAGTYAIGIDFIELFGRNFVKAQGLVGLGYNESVYLDSRYNSINRMGTGGDGYVDWVYQGSDGIYLTPKRDNLLMFMYQTNTGTLAEISRYASVTVAYYPRRRTL